MLHHSFIGGILLSQERVMIGNSYSECVNGAQETDALWRVFFVRR
jgi:hypothetical protein